MRTENLTRYAWLSIAAAVATITLKAGAYALTGSVGLLSDALESLINLAAALIALWALKAAARPPDDEHMYGHGKIEYFSSGIEGALILTAALSIGYAAAVRLFAPVPLEQVGIGLGITLLATLINFVVARVLLRAGREHHSIVLEADGHHLMTDVWTSLGVVVGLAAVALTGWWRLDALIAFAVALNILWSGWKLINRSVQGLIDISLSKEAQERVIEVLDDYVRRENIDYHALRTRQAGAQKFVNVHILVPGCWTVKEGHDLLEKIEADIRKTLGNTAVFTHLEPLEDPSSHEDIELIRKN